MFMEVQLDLSLSTHSSFEFKPWRNDECLLKMKKRSFEDAFDNNSTNESKQSTLPLLLWSGQPNDEDDDHNQKKEKRLSCPFHKNDEGVAEEENLVVGWPPVKSWRKKLLHSHQEGGGRIIIKNRLAAGGNENNNMNGTAVSNYKYVKVKMAGVVIARKIDLRLFHSYQTLTNFLIAMFVKCQHFEEHDSSNYTLTYQDKDGEWLLAGDVPWQSFIESVQRLELRRNES